MKRLAKDERLGAIALALVSLLICGGAFLLRRHSGGDKVSESAVRSIILVSDSIKEDNRKSLQGDSLKRSNRKKNKGSLTGEDPLLPRSTDKKKSLKEKTKQDSKQPKRKKGKAKKGKEPVRDILSEPIPQ